MLGFVGCFVLVVLFFFYCFVLRCLTYLKGLPLCPLFFSVLVVFAAVSYYCMRGNVFDGISFLFVHICSVISVRVF